MPDPFAMERTRLSPWDPAPALQKDAARALRNNSFSGSEAESSLIQASSAPAAPPALPSALAVRMPERSAPSFSYRFFRRR